ncbi:MAG: sulfotransferase domain-containing protein [Candidatus Protochlamydia sp.]|nr:sulfotransferase domain-containing protein [Candidatus Protochlamydia sp.]
MKYSAYKSSLFIFVSSFSLLTSMFCYAQENPIISDFFVLTIPKSGTHMALKMLHMLTSKKGVIIFHELPVSYAGTFREDISRVNFSTAQIEEFFSNWKINNSFVLAHFNLADDFNRFWLDHTDYIKIIQIRDLRDVCVSCVFHQSEDIEKEIGPSSFAEKLLFVICLGSTQTKNRLFHIKKHAKIALEWMQEPHTVLCRFENLVGEQGGGSLKSQREQIAAIAESLNIELNTEKLNWITDNLFGINTGPLIPSTYREGKIGSWRNYFNDEHKRAFEEHLGDIQLSLGYCLFDDERN